MTDRIKREDHGILPGVGRELVICGSTYRFGVMIRDGNSMTDAEMIAAAKQELDAWEADIRRRLKA